MNEHLPALVAARMRAAAVTATTRPAPGDPVDPVQACGHIPAGGPRVLICALHPAALRCPLCQAEHAKTVHPAGQRCEACEIREAVPHPPLIDGMALEDFPIRVLTAHGVEGCRIVRKELQVTDIAAWCNLTACAEDVRTAVGKAYGGGPH